MQNKLKESFLFCFVKINNFVQIVISRDTRVLKCRTHTSFTHSRIISIINNNIFCSFYSLFVCLFVIYITETIIHILKISCLYSKHTKLNIDLFFFIVGKNSNFIL